MKAIFKTFLYAVLIAALCMTGVYLAMAVAYWNFSIPDMGGGQRLFLAFVGVVSFFCTAGALSETAMTNLTTERKLEG